MDWTYEGYWAVVLGDDRSAADVLRDCSLVDAVAIDAWLVDAEDESWAEGGHGDDEIPDEWSAHHARALAELEAALPAEVAS